MKFKTRKLMNAYNPKFTGGSYAGNVYDPHCCSPALNTMTGGGRMPFILLTYEMEDDGHHCGDPELRPDSSVTPLGNCRYDIDGREIEFRIRKLSPRECYRLMDVPDNVIDTMMQCDENGKQLISNSQHYRMAGNSIVTSCLLHIYEQIWYPKASTSLTPKQLTLF